jgi:NDP-sugar pyrophosphorylase family protein
MKAFILAAGMGTRLGSLTADKPKALVEVNGKSMLENLILHLKLKGIQQVLINVHHFSDKIIQHVEVKNNFGVDITFSDESQELLDTGGAIRKAADFFKGNESILVHNVDVASGINFEDLESYHKKNNALATLCVRKRESSRALLFDEKMQLSGWANWAKDDYKWVNKPMTTFDSFAYSGIYLVQPDFAKKLPFTVRFSIIDAWLKMAKTEKIIAFEDKSAYWFDLGTKVKIGVAEKYLKRKNP